MSRIRSILTAAAALVPIPVVLIALAGLALAGPAAAAQASRGDSYQIGPRDQVAIRVFEEPRLNVDVRVNEDGTVRLPLVGRVPAEGLTESELAARLKQILERQLLQRASVSVEVVEFRSRPISVIGAVRQPGSLNFSGRLTLLEAITAAGGLADNHGDSIFVLRRADNGLTDQVAIRIDDLLVRADPDVNIPIFANDLINIPAAVELTVYCLGEVANPGALSFQSTERVTLLAAIARAGGLTDRAAKKILIRRHRAEGNPQEIWVSYKAIVSGRETDPDLHEGDVVIVKESFF